MCDSAQALVRKLALLLVQHIVRGPAFLEIGVNIHEQPGTGRIGRNRDAMALGAHELIGLEELSDFVLTQVKSHLLVCSFSILLEISSVLTLLIMFPFLVLFLLFL